jgi:hypothetical protein
MLLVSNFFSWDKYSRWMQYFAFAIRINRASIFFQELVPLSKSRPRQQINPPPVE